VKSIIIEICPTTHYCLLFRPNFHHHQAVIIDYVLPLTEGSKLPALQMNRQNYGFESLGHLSTYFDFVWRDVSIVPNT